MENAQVLLKSSSGGQGRRKKEKEARELVSILSGGRAFLSGERQVQRQERPWCVQGTARGPVWLEQMSEGLT